MEGFADTSGLPALCSTSPGNPTFIFSFDEARDEPFAVSNCRSPTQDSVSWPEQQCDIAVHDNSIALGTHFRNEHKESQKVASLIIRPATQADAEVIANINVEGWRSAYKNLLPPDYLASLSRESRKRNWLEILSKQEKNKITFLAELAGKFVGFVSCGPERTNDLTFVGEIYAIYLLQEHQRQGVGTALFRKAIDFLLERDLNSLKVWVLSNNPYRAFYELHGGRVIDAKGIVIGQSELRESAYGWISLKSADEPKLK